MDHIVELELVDLTSIKLTEPVPDVIQQPAKLLLVIRGDRHASCPPLSPVVRTRALGHRGEATPERTSALPKGAVYRLFGGTATPTTRHYVSL